MPATQVRKIDVARKHAHTLRKKVQPLNDAEAQSCADMLDDMLGPDGSDTPDLDNAADSDDLDA